MISTQIQLTEEQSEQLRQLSLSNRESVAALIRKAVDQFLMTGNPDRSALYRQALSVVGKYESGLADISVKHDQYLDEAFGS